MVGVVGIALKGFGKALKVVKDTGLHKGSVRKATSPKVMGTQRPKTKSDFSLKNQIKKIQKEPDKRFKSHNPETEKVKSLRTGREFEVRKKDPVKGSLGKKTYIQDTKYYHHANKPKGKAEGGRIGFKRGKAVTKADLAKSDLWRKRILKKRSKIGQRKSKWDVLGAISGHPLNPFRMHAEGKALDWTSKRKDVYVRTRDDLKKSQDPKVRGVAEAFQQMDYKDKAKGTQFEKDYEPKLTKRTHVGRKTGGKVNRERKFGGALVRGAKNIVKHTPWRKELAGLRRTYRTKQKILRTQAGRAKQAKQKAFETKHIKPASQETKVAISRSRNPKTWRRAGKLPSGWGNR